MRYINAASIAVLALGSVVSAQLAQTCDNNVCFSLNIPDATASSGSGDIYMQITAPTTYTWVALGQGSQMSGANMFVLYTDAAGSNVTLSPRLGTGHAQPKYNSASQVTLLDGTGVSDGVMTANIRCSNCDSWSGGSMDLTSSSGSFIYAMKSGDPLNSDSTSADISQHGSQNSFKLDLTQARGGDSLNPFSTSAATTSGSSSGSGSSASAAATTCSSTVTTETSTIASPSGSGCPTAWPTAWTTSWPTSRPTEYASCYSGYGGYGRNGKRSAWPTAAPYIKAKRADDSSCSSEAVIQGGASSYGSGSSGSSGSSSSSGFGISKNGIPFGGDAAKAQTVMIAHGVMASLAFVILFPFGAISIRLFSFPGLIWFHAGCQALAYLIFIAAFGLGIYLAQEIRMMNAAHPIIGIVLFVLIFFQPILGILHHKFFKKYSRRTFWSHAHIWLGRIVITLGIINGGLGLQLAGNSHSGEIAYAVIAAIVWLAYVASIIVGENRRRKNSPPAYDKSMKMDQVRSASPSPPRHRYG